MAIEPLATVADLADLGISVDDPTLAHSLLASVSADVREAAGSLITVATSTVEIATEASRRVELPARPVRDVSDVELDGAPLVEGVDYVAHSGCLWRLGGRPWHRYGDIPSVLKVTFTHGYDVVPADVVRTVCMYVAAGLAAAKDEFSGNRGLQYVGVDDYREGYLSGSDEVVDPAELTERTKRNLRARFGAFAGPNVIGSQR